MILIDLIFGVLAPLSIIFQLSVADLEGRCGACAPPPPKIRKAYVIQR